MLTYSPPEHRVQKSTYESSWLLILLVFVWLWPAVFMRDLWNPAEPRIFAAINESPSAWLPTVFGQPYFQVSPVYLMLSGSLKSAFSPLLSAYDAARLASVLFSMVGLLASGMAADKLLGKQQQYGRSTVLILIGTVGLLQMAHFLSDVSVAFAGVALCFWAMAVAERQVVWSAILLGLGCIFIGQSLGWLAAWCALSVPLVVWCHVLWRSRRLITVWIGAMLMVLPALLIQLFLLAKLNPEYLRIYTQNHLFGDYGGLAGVNWAWQGWYYSKHLLWFALPAYPLAIWTATRVKLWQNKYGVLAIAWLWLFGIWLVFNPTRFQDNLVVWLPALAILAVMCLDDLRRGVAAFWNWFGIMTFGAAAIFLWIGFVAMNYGFPKKLAERAAYFSPDYVHFANSATTQIQMILGLVVMPIWLFAITRKRIRGRQAVTNWAAGMTLVWALAFTLFVTWFDAAKSYRPTVQKIMVAMGKDFSGCLNIAPENGAARLAWQEYGHAPIQTDLRQRCEFELRQVNPQDDLADLKDRIVWQGKRPRNKVESFILLKNE